MENMKDKFLKFVEESGPNILASIVILVLGIVVIKVLLNVLKKAFKRSKLDPICHKFIVSFIKVTLYIILIIITLSNLGVPMTSLVTLLGAAGLAISLAVKDSLANLAGGFILLFSKPFKVGDYIELSGISGTVKHINILQTKLNTIDNKAIFIPNGQVSSDKIINYSAEATRRLDLTFSISYKDDIITAKKLLENIVLNHEFTLKDPAPVIRVCEHASNSINIVVKVWVSTENYWDLNYDLLEGVKLLFDDNNITIPFNQIDVNLISK